MKDVLRKLAPKTPASKRDRFVPYLEEAMPRYGITDRDDQAKFLATICFESDYFKTTKEYKADEGSEHWRKYQSKYWNTGYYGRGLIQLTHKTNYVPFIEHVRKTHGVDLIREDIEHPKWAVESACWFWLKNKLNGRTFFATQGRVNRGSATKRALDYDRREALYKIALSAIPSSPEAANQPTEADTATPLPSDDQTNATSTSSGTFFSTTMDKLAGVKAKFDAIGVDPTTISKPSWFAIIWQKVWAGILFVIGLYMENPWILAGTVVLLIVAAILYNNARKRAREAAK